MCVESPIRDGPVAALTVACDVLIESHFCAVLAIGVGSPTADARDMKRVVQQIERPLSSIISIGVTEAWGIAKDCIRLHQVESSRGRVWLYSDWEVVIEEKYSRFRFHRHHASTVVRGCCA